MARTDLHIRVGFELVEGDQGEVVGVLWEVGDADAPLESGYQPVQPARDGEVEPWT